MHQPTVEHKAQATLNNWKLVLLSLQCSTHQIFAKDLLLHLERVTMSSSGRANVASI